MGIPKMHQRYSGLTPFSRYDRISFMPVILFYITLLCLSVISVELAFLCGSLILTAGLLCAWMETTLPIHVFHIISRVTGWKNKVIDDMLPEWESDYERWLIFAITSCPAWLSTLLSCRYCLSFHIALWVSLLMYAATMFTVNPMYILVSVGMSTVGSWIIHNEVAK